MADMEKGAAAGAGATKPGVFATLTYWDMFEKVGQILYCVQLGFVPKYWLRENLAEPEKYTGDAVVLCLCSVVAALCFGLTGYSLIARTFGPSASQLKKVDLMAALTWGVCGCANLWHRDVFKFQNAVTNIAFQFFIAAGFLVQLALRKEGKMFDM